MRGNDKLCWLFASATLALGYVCGESPWPCARGESWWDRERGACAPCTRCDPARRLVVVYPCQLHRDTICHSFFNIQVFPTRTQNTSKISDPPSDYEYEYADYDSEVRDEREDRWDLQTSSVALASCGCVVFFLVVLYFSLSHAKQWRMLKHTLQSDMKDLTAKMKLMEEGGESPTEPVTPVDHHLYCNVHIGKDALLGVPTDKKGLGNVYTQEKHPS